MPRLINQISQLVFFHSRIYHPFFFKNKYISQYYFAPNLPSLSAQFLSKNHIYVGIYTFFFSKCQNRLTARPTQIHHFLIFLTFLLSPNLALVGNFCHPSLIPPSRERGNFSLARGPPTIVYINPILDKATSMKLYMSIVMTGTGDLYKVLSVHFSNSYDASRPRDYQFNIGQSHIDEVIHVHNDVWDKIIV